MSQDHVLYPYLSYRYPTIVEGKGVYLYETEGNRYLDATYG
jgi:adenosylmethionine-8-amino-7-oxononanoate aminotransferase